MLRKPTRSHSPTCRARRFSRAFASEAMTSSSEARRAEADLEWPSFRFVEKLSRAVFGLVRSAISQPPCWKQTADEKENYGVRPVCKTVVFIIKFSPLSKPKSQRSSQNITTFLSRKGKNGHFPQCCLTCSLMQFFKNNLALR